MSYKHLTINERVSIETMNKLGYSNRKIASHLGRHHSTIAREVKRCKSINIYQAEIAHKDYQTRRKKCKAKGKYTESIGSIIEDKLQKTWSPEQIANTVSKGKVSFKTIYNWIYEGKLNVTLNKLRHKGKSRNLVEKRGRFTIGLPISQRPKEVKTRKTFGHWELDTMVSSRGKSKGCFATFLERKTRLYTVIKIPDRTANSMEWAIDQLLNILPKGSMKTATTDRGKEFSCYTSISAKHDIPMYFADPYSSWQRGSNENSNGLMREFYPKKTDLALVNQQELAKNLFLLNSRPRKCLGWKTPIEMFLHEVSHLA